jgi:hypothetical protein
LTIEFVHSRKAGCTWHSESAGSSSPRYPLPASPGAQALPRDDGFRANGAQGVGDVAARALGRHCGRKEASVPRSRPTSCGGWNMDNLKRRAPILVRLQNVLTSVRLLCRDCCDSRSPRQSRHPFGTALLHGQFAGTPRQFSFSTVCDHVPLPFLGSLSFALPSIGRRNVPPAQRVRGRVGERPADKADSPQPK